MIVVVAAHVDVVAGDRSIDLDRCIQQTLVRDLVFAIAFLTATDLTGFVPVLENLESHGI